MPVLLLWFSTWCRFFPFSSVPGAGSFLIIQYQVPVLPVLFSTRCYYVPDVGSPLVLQCQLPVLPTLFGTRCQFSPYYSVPAAGTHLVIQYQLLILPPYYFMPVHKKYSWYFEDKTKRGQFCVQKVMTCCKHWMYWCTSSEMKLLSAESISLPFEHICLTLYGKTYMDTIVANISFQNQGY